VGQGSGSGSGSGEGMGMPEERSGRVRSGQVRWT